jgi:hypothetical protein
MNDGRASAAEWISDDDDDGGGGRWTTTAKMQDEPAVVQGQDYYTSTAEPATVQENGKWMPPHAMSSGRHRDMLAFSTTSKIRDQKSH